MKMAKKYKTGLILISICLFFTLIVSYSYIKYKNYIESTNPLVIVEDGLSINYMEGNKIHVNGENKTYTFSITNNTNNNLQYYITLENILSNQDTIVYDLIEKNGTIHFIENSLSNEDNNLVNLVKINSGDTHFYTLTFYENNNIEFSGELSVRLEEGNEEYFASILLKNNEIKQQPTTQLGIEIATDNEGLIEAQDDTGTFYYFRGNVENNYVSLANLMWRIVKINSDGSIRLILNDYIETTGNFYETNSEETLNSKLNFSQNKMYNYLNNWYQENLEEYEKNLISNKYCVDDSIYTTENDIHYYLGYSRLLNEYNEDFNCLGTDYTSRIGLLSADEVVLAGATANLSNKEYYLYVPDKFVSWWTLTPSYSNETDIIYFEVDTQGKIVSENNGNYFKGVRPVINLVKKTSVTGTGTSTDPYTLK